MLNVSQRAIIIQTFCNSRLADLSGMSRPFFLTLTNVAEANFVVDSLFPLVIESSVEIPISTIVTK